MESKVLAAGAIGAGIGALQTPLFREFVDKKYPTWAWTSLNGFGKPSALIGMGAGAAALLIGGVGATKGKDGRPRLSDMPVAAAIDYGIVSLIGGIFSGLYPVIPVALAPSVQRASSFTYKPPQQAASMDAMQKMSAEIQRLSQQNAAMRTQTQSTQIVQPIPTPLQKRYGFMSPEKPLAPRAMFVPGQPTKAAREAGFMAPGTGIAPEHMFVPGQPTRISKGFGFMDGGSTPVAAVQQMKTKFDFSG